MRNSSTVLMVRLSLMLVLGMAFYSCRTSPTGPHETSNVQLSADYVACTEVWLKIAFNGEQSANGEYRITRDSTTVLTGSFSGPDTIVIDTTTEAERTYTYQAYRLVNGKVSEFGSPIEVTTLDSTSNDFTWRAYTFGGNAGSCILNDVTVINDTDVWAVGDIPLKDSSADGYSVYNLVRWNGSKWSLERVPYIYQGELYYHPIEAVFALGTDDVWLGGNGLEHWVADGFEDVEAVNPFFLGHLIEKIWGDPEGGIYIVGDAGTAIESVNGGWHQTATGTSLTFHDVLGVSDSATGQQEVLAVASDQFTNNGVAVLQLSGAQATMIQTTGLPTTNMVGIWSASGREWYICGAGLYRSRSLNSPWEEVKGLPSINMEAIRGNGPNDIFVVGDYGLITHFNGSTWSNLTQQFNPNTVFYAVSVKGNTVVAVGATGVPGDSPALILVGKRN